MMLPLDDTGIQPNNFVLLVGFNGVGEDSVLANTKSLSEASVDVGYIMFVKDGKSVAEILCKTRSGI